MAGLIKTQLAGTKLQTTPKAGEFLETEALGYDPSKAAVNVDTDTVAGQLAGLMTKENPVMLQARTKAAQTANARGLLNSSMAVEAGESAAIGAALPIAQSDAATYSQQRLANQGAENTAYQFGAGAENAATAASAAAGNVGARTAQTGLIQKELSTQEAEQRSALSTQQAGETGTLSAQEAEQRSALSTQQAGETGTLSAQEAAQREAAIKVQAEEESKLQTERAEQAQALALTEGQLATELQTLRGTQAQALANTEATYRQLIQTSASAGAFYNDMTKMIAAVLADTNTTAEQKEAAIGKLSELLESGLTVLGSIADVDLAGLLTFGP